MIQLYKPNKALKGFACSFWYSERDEAVYATLIKQSSAGDEDGKGAFKASLEDPSKKTHVKFSWVEVSAILDAIERGRPFSQYHQNEENSKQVSFVPWMTKPQDGSAPKSQGFSFSVTVSSKENTTVKNPFYIGLTFAEARFIREFLIFCLQKSFASYKKNYVPKDAPITEVPLSEPAQTEPEEVKSSPETATTYRDPLIDF